jgi:hypothetical protein
MRMETWVIGGSLALAGFLMGAMVMALLVSSGRTDL